MRKSMAHNYNETLKTIPMVPKVLTIKKSFPFQIKHNCKWTKMSIQTD
uniref:Uncharacterized protein n=1 Tax=Anguilla anguilla TaxID=7936 RepID=A0A0E9X7I4_ANGAN